MLWQERLPAIALVAGLRLRQLTESSEGGLMFMRIDQALPDPLYRQIRDEIVRGIAQGELAPGDALPSVRNLAGDLGINLHTVNKAYALLRDEGFVLMRGRQGAYVAQPRNPAKAGAAESGLFARDVRRLALAFKAAGGGRETFEQLVKSQLDDVF